MAKVISAGLLMFRRRHALEFFLVHPGGPFFKNKNEGVWGIPKGLLDSGEEMLVAAQREFKEETGITPAGPYQSLGETKLKSGKTIYAWSFKGDWDEETGITSNYISLEWPPRSGKRIDIPEIDKGGWFTLLEAKDVINPAQLVFLQRASEIIAKLQ